MSQPRSLEGLEAGHAVYTKAFLRIYDPLVLGFFGRFVWRCPTSVLVDRYDALTGDPHLDVGPGTGYFLQEIAPPGSVTLLDPNPNVLAHCRARLANLQPTAIQADILESPPDIGRFGSVGMNYVLHCLPSRDNRKAMAVANAATLLRDSGVLFGATVLGSPDVHTLISRRALAANNRRGIFDNRDDSVETLAEALDQSFHETSIDVIGSVAVFSARTPRRDP